MAANAASAATGAGSAASSGGAASSPPESTQPSARTRRRGSSTGERPDEPVMDAVDRLLQEQKRVREERKRVTLDLKNAVRRRNRLKTRARLLSANDLVAVMNMREVEAARKNARTAAAAAAATGHTQRSQAEASPDERADEGSNGEL